MPPKKKNNINYDNDNLLAQTKKLVVFVSPTDDFPQDWELPKQHTGGSAGYDIKALIPDDGVNGQYRILMPGATIEFRTGLRFQLPENHALFVYARSGMGCKHNLRPANCVGILDSDYTGELKVFLHNDGKLNKEIKHGDRIAQFIIQSYPELEFQRVDELPETERGDGGGGSTGVN